MFKIANLTDTNKRIRLTALDSAMSNIDDSVGAVAKVGREVLLCLAPKGAEEQPSDKANEMHFTTLAGTVDYLGVAGDQIIFSDGTSITLVEEYLYDFAVPSGKHKVVLVETRSHEYVGLGGEALVEINNFPTLSSVNAVNTCPNNSSPNLVKVPTTLPSNITQIQFMFSGATSFNQDISMWDTSNVTHIQYMFNGASAFNQPLNSWNVSNVTDMSNMFQYATSFDQPLNSWNVSNVTDMYYMFNGASAFNQDLSQWCVSNITEHPSIFDLDATNWTLPKPVWGTCPTGEDDDDEVQEPLWDIKYKVNGEWVYEVTGPVVEVSDTRNSQYRGLATELVVSDRVTEIGYLAFRYWSNLVRVDLGNTVRSISNYAFEACTGLKDIVFSNSLEVIGDSSFGGCQSLKVLDFGENLQTINSWALVNLYKLHTIVFRSNTIPTFKSNVFGNGSSGGTNPQYVYAPDHLVNEYYHALENELLNLRLDGSCKPLSQYTG